MNASLSFDDVLIEPRLSDIKSRRDVSLRTRLTKNIYLNTPLISSPMDTITEDKMAISMALHGGLGIIHRYNKIEEQAEMIRNVKRYIGFIIRSPYVINESSDILTLEKYIRLYNVHSFLVVNFTNNLVGLITRRDIASYELLNNNNDNYKMTKVSNIMTPRKNLIVVTENVSRDEAIELMVRNKIEKLPVIDQNDNILGLITFKNLYDYSKNNKYYSLDDKKERLLVGGAVGIVGDYLDRADALVKEGVDIICIDVANGHNTHVKKCITELKERYPTLPILAGNVCTAEGCKFLCEAGADCIRIGIGNGSICTTRLVTGCGKGQFSAVKECREFINNSKYSHVGLVSDGGNCGKDGNIGKAIAVGADCVMLGRTLSATDETPGRIIMRNGKRVKYYRGMASDFAMISKSEKMDLEFLGEQVSAEGVDTEIEIKGPVREILLRIITSLKSMMSYIGCKNMDVLRSSIIAFVQQTPIGANNETGIFVHI